MLASTLLGDGGGGERAADVSASIFDCQPEVAV